MGYRPENPLNTAGWGSSGGAQRIVAKLSWVGAELSLSPLSGIMVQSQTWFHKPENALKRANGECKAERPKGDFEKTAFVVGVCARSRGRNRGGQLLGTRREGTPYLCAARERDSCGPVGVMT